MLNFLSKSDRQKSFIYNTLAQSLTAGLPIIQIFSILENQISKPASLKFAFKKIKSDIERGSNIHNAIRKFPKIFSSYECELVKLGEESGNLDEILSILSDFFEKKYKRSLSKIKMFFYPAFLLFLTNYIISIRTIFTKGAFSYLVATNGRLLLLLLLIFIVRKLFFFLKSFTPTEVILDQLKLMIPVIGKIYRNESILLFLRGLSLNYRAGMELKQSVTLAVSTCPDRIFKNKIKKIPSQLDSGLSMSQLLVQTNLFPSYINQAFLTGETTGNLDGMIDKFSEIMEQETNLSYDNLVKVTGILTFLLIAFIVGFFIVSSYIQIYDFTLLP
ncbi:MAG: hypothetical protein A2161_00675 [Candidatus Schekmanbacteria bacterium RBG_13_48_7]|uniref:Type II secretion system protein GspF domain-containing protein n=1 Tax=Candidatus Schekmanbacteria bacterium RBG_13_48_7 TaxID=1817878 RepID=A0A1F7RXB8_9BACT|nr:MAG: hypothetical protein A2161_00675 [Candidatus Schekmanbacteria bacterium RBG_13_48_7]